MTIRADEEIFILSDEIIDQIYRYFPRSGSHHDRTIQACMALQALINVISMMLCEIDSEFAIKAAADSFTQMLKDLPAIMAEVEHEPKAQSMQ